MAARENARRLVVALLAVAREELSRPFQLISTVSSGKMSSTTPACLVSSSYTASPMLMVSASDG